MSERIVVAGQNAYQNAYQKEKVFFDFDGVIRDLSSSSSRVDIIKTNIVFGIADHLYKHNPSLFARNTPKFYKGGYKTNQKIIELIRELQQDGYEVAVLTSNNNVGAIKQELAKNGLYLDVEVKQPLDKLRLAKEKGTVIVDDGYEIKLLAIFAYSKNLVSFQGKHNLLLSLFRRNTIRADESLESIKNKINSAIKNAER